MTAYVPPPAPQFKVVYINKLMTSPKQLYLLSVPILNMDEEIIESSQARTHLRFVSGGQEWRYKVRELKRGAGNYRDEGRRLCRHPTGRKNMLLAIDSRTWEKRLVELVFDRHFEEWEDLVGRN